MDQQLAEGRRRAHEFGYEVVAEYYDNDVSASEYSTKERPDWEKVERDIENGVADVLWLWEISRGTRDLVVWAHLARACQGQQMWITLNDDEWDTTKTSHMKHLNQQMIDAIGESGRTHDRVTRDVDANAERGGVHGGWGFGFRHEFHKSTGEFLRRVVYEPEARVVREVAQRFLSGEGLRSVARDLNDREVPTASGAVAGQLLVDGDGRPVMDELTGQQKVGEGWHYQTLKQVLLRTAMIGKRSHHGKLIREGGHQALFDGTEERGVVLDEAAWWKVRRKLLSRSPSSEVPRRNSGVDGRTARGAAGPRDGSATHLLSGIGVCGVCGAPMYPTQHKKVACGWVYRCVGLYEGAPAAHVLRTGTILDAAVQTLVFARFSRPDALQAFLPAKKSAEEVATAQARKAEIRSELEELVAEVESGQVSRRLAAADERRLETELERVEEILRPEAVEPMAVELARSDAWMVKQAWEDWSLEQQRRALRVFATRIEVPVLGRGRRNVPPSEYVHITWAGRAGD